MTENSLETGCLLSSAMPASAIRLVCFALLFGAGTFCYPNASAQDASAQDASTDEVNANSTVLVGIDGRYRAGHHTLVRLADDSELSGEERAGMFLQTLDGDGVRVRFEAIDQQQSVSAELGYVVPGSEAAPLVIGQRREDQFQTLMQTRLPVAGDPGRGPSMVAATMPWIIAIGDPLGVDQIGVSNVLKDKLARFAVTKIDDASSLPSRAIGYDGVDAIMINSSGLPVLAAMAEVQHQAINNWIRSGGRLFVCLGESTPEIVAAAPWLERLLPIDEVELVRLDPAALETFTSSLSPLDTFQGIKLPRGVGRPLLIGRTLRRITAVISAHYVVGFGQVTVIAADLDAPLFEQWPERMDLITRINADLLSDPKSDQKKRDGSTSYGDLAGQTRGTLDQFDLKREFSFSLLSLIVMLLIAAIGPIDYLLVNRVLGRPLLGWMTFPLIAVALSVVLYYQSKPTQAGEATTSLLRSNQIQVTDLDWVSGSGRSFAWAYIYSHESADVDVTYRMQEQLGSMTDDAAPMTDRTVFFPMGYPGKVFGGIQLASESQLPAYSVHDAGQSQPRGDETAPPDPAAGADGLTLAPRSSKSLAAKLTFNARVDPQWSVTRRPGSELLRGKFVNPLPVDLLDGMLIYGNWVYLLPTRVPAGSQIDSLGDLRQRNFRWRLTRQQLDDDNNSGTTPWSPSDFGNRERIAEMLMFHGAAGGQLYTGLQHNALSELDLSHALVDDRCILVGRTEEPLLELNVTDAADDDRSSFTPAGDVLSMVRVILPVRSTRLN